MSGMQVLPLGVGDAFSSLFYTSCLALRSEDQWLLVDCPHPIRKILREGATQAGLELDIGDLSGVVLTHLHADHSSGIEDLAFYSRLMLQRRPALLCHPRVSERLWESLQVTMEEMSVPELELRFPAATLETWIDLHDLSDERAIEYGPFRIECRRTIHPLFTTALRISAAGRTLGVSSDTAYHKDLLDWLCQADLVFHECGPGIHTPYEQLLALPPSRRDRIRLIHLSDDFDRQASEIEVAEQGRLYEV